MRWWALLPTRGEVSGSTHPDTLAARADLAQWTELASGSDGWVDFELAGGVESHRARGTSSSASMTCP